MYIISEIQNRSITLQEEVGEMKKFWSIEEAFKVQRDIEDGEIISVGNIQYRRSIVPWFDGFVKIGDIN
jgi:hypothetical protein